MLIFMREMESIRKGKRTCPGDVLYRYCCALKGDCVECCRFGSGQTQIKHLHHVVQLSTPSVVFVDRLRIKSFYYFEFFYSISLLL